MGNTVMAQGSADYRSANTVGVLNDQVYLILARCNRYLFFKETHREYKILSAQVTGLLFYPSVTV